MGTIYFLTVPGNILSVFIVFGVTCLECFL